MSAISIPFADVGEVKVDLAGEINDVSAVVIRKGHSFVKVWPPVDEDFIEIVALDGPVEVYVETPAYLTSKVELSYDKVFWQELTSEPSGTVYVRTTFNVGTNAFIRLSDRESAGESSKEICKFNFSGRSAIRGDLMRSIGHARKPKFSGDIVDASWMFIRTTQSQDSQFRETFVNCTELQYAPSYVMCSGRQCCLQMFEGCTSLISTPALPSTDLYEHCYSSMFKGCTSLTEAPDLPATVLALSCYNSMFSGCTSLISAPDLPATTLANGCYSTMFKGCTALNSAPSLPVTTLASGCYSSMFEGCTSLTAAPDLPATTLASECYQYMFSGCTSLTSAPALPATTLVSYCYRNMFEGCSSLVFAIAAAVPTSNSIYHMFTGVASSGTLHAPGTIDDWAYGSTAGLPSTWTVIN